MAINATALEASWTEIVRKIRNRWGQVSNDDLHKVHGDAEQLVSLIERKTGMEREQVENFLSDLTLAGASRINSAVTAGTEYAGEVAHAVERVVTNASGYAQEGYRATARTVRERPLESVAVGFGAALVAGIVIGLVLKPR